MSEIPILNFDDFFADLPSAFDPPPPMNESGRPKVIAEGSRIINGVSFQEFWRLSYVLLFPLKTC